MAKDLAREFESRFHRRDLKLTRPRELIVQKILSHKAGEHFSADQLWHQLRRRGAGVSKATVYRTLSLLVGEKIVEEHDFGKGEKYYERMVARPHHDHLVCIHCGRIIEFENANIERLQEQVAKKYDFSITYHTHKLFGTCSRCWKKKIASS